MVSALILTGSITAERVRLYEEMPVPDEWHDNYAEGQVDPDEYLDAIRYHDAWF